MPCADWFPVCWQGQTIAQASIMRPTCWPENDGDNADAFASLDAIESMLKFNLVAVMGGDIIGADQAKEDLSRIEILHNLIANDVAALDSIVFPDIY